MCVVIDLVSLEGGALLGMTGSDERPWPWWLKRRQRREEEAGMDTRRHDHQKLWVFCSGLSFRKARFVLILLSCFSISSCLCLLFWGGGGDFSVFLLFSDSLFSSFCGI